MKTDIISDKWTTRELKSYIREETASMNYRLLEYYESTTNPSPIVDKIKARLVELGTGKENKNGFIGLGLTYKTKAELLQQARALQEAKQVDIYTQQGLREYSEKEEAAYNTFIKNRPALAGMTLDEYHDLVEAFGALGSHIMEEFGYEELALIYHSATSERKLDMVSAVKDTLRENKGTGITQKTLIKSLREKLLDD